MDGLLRVDGVTTEGAPPTAGAAPGGARRATHAPAAKSTARRGGEQKRRPTKKRPGARRWDMLRSLHTTSGSAIPLPEMISRSEVLRSIPLFGGLDPGTLHRLALKMQRQEFAPGQAIVTQGDDGESVFVIERGRTTVSISRGGEVEDEVNEMGAGETFGELALLTGDKRVATVQAVGDVSVLRLGRGDVQQLLRKQWGSPDHLQSRADMLAKVPVFAKLSQAELLMLATSLTCHEFGEPGAEIVVEGDAGDSMFVVEEGQAIAFKSTLGYVSDFGPGDFFGEMAVLEDGAVRQATVKAGPEASPSQPVVVLKLGRRDLRRMLSCSAAVDVLATKKQSCECLCSISCPLWVVSRHASAGSPWSPHDKLTLH
jgi:CRP-like cAMP-binding protein